MVSAFPGPQGVSQIAVPNPVSISALSAITQADVDDNLLLYVVDVTGGTVSRKVSRANLFAGTKQTQLPITLPSAPTGSASEFVGAIKVSAGTISFATTNQTGDYITDKIDQATLVNPSATPPLTITNASTLKIVGAPIASTNVTITNAYALWVAGDTFIAGNKLITSNTTFQEDGTSAFGTSTGVWFTRKSGNSTPVFGLYPAGTSNSTVIAQFRTNDRTTNYELMYFSSDVHASNQFEISVDKLGTGTLRPLTVYMSSTKLLSFDTANTITSYVDFLQTTGKKISLNVGLTSYIMETSAGQIDIFTNSNQGLRIVQGVTTTTENNVVIGKISALATTASDGFLHIPSGAGAPTGIPTLFTGKIPLYYDSTNNFLYVYNGGWKKSTVYA